MTQPPAYAVGQSFDGFEVTRVTPLPAQRSIAYELRHPASGATIIHIHNDDEDNLFSVTFPTPPADDTGVPHILEHAVLGGSKRFPVKDPFFEMIKMSMATFINAMTAYDHTYYPVTSNVRNDYYNLAEVYWDAVFYPELTENTFLREGHHLEPVDREKPTGDLMVKGIVFNEMKGVFSSANSLVGRASLRRLFPENAYGNESGGDPVSITNLTYKQFTDFHAQFYHPSNALIFLYGNIPTADHLSFLKEKLGAFNARKVDARVHPQPLWKAPKSDTIPYPVGADEPTAGRSYITMNWIVGDGTDAELVMAFDVLETVLLGNQAALLRRAIVDSKLGADLTHSGYHAGILQGTFHIGIKGTEPERCEAFETLVIKTLTEIADRGIEPQRIDAAFQQLAYDHLEISGDFPLRQLGAVKSAWLYGRDPLQFVRAREHLEALRTRIEKDPTLFSQLIREYLLNNPHRLTLTFVPDKLLEAQQEAQSAEKLKAIRAQLTSADLVRIAEKTAELEIEANRPNTPEQLATLPHLHVEDLPASPTQIPFGIERLGTGMDLLRNDVFANGVNYLQLDLDLAALPFDLIAYLPLFADCMRKMGAAGTDFAAMAQRISASTGGVSFSPYCGTHVTDPSRDMRRARLAIKFLDENADNALSVLHDLLFKLDLTDRDRLRDVIQQSAAAHRTSVVERGLNLAQVHAARDLNLESLLTHEMSGLPQLRLMLRLADQFESEYENIVGKLQQIQHLMLNRAGLAAGFTGTARLYDQICDTLTSWSSAMPATLPTAQVFTMPADTSPHHEGLAFPMQVAFCSRVLKAPHISDPDAASLSIAARLIGLDYLLDEIRFKGTAYGGGCSYTASSSTFAFYSYRDPWVGRTLQVFDGTLNYVRQADWNQSRIERAVISTAKNALRPIRPAEATAVTLSRHVSGDTAEHRQAYYSKLLASTTDIVRQSAIHLLENRYAHGSICVVSNRQKLGEADLAVEDLIPQ